MPYRSFPQTVAQHTQMLNSANDFILVTQAHCNWITRSVSNCNLYWILELCTFLNSQLFSYFFNIFACFPTTISFLFSGLNRHFCMLQKAQNHSEESRVAFKILQLPADLHSNSSVVGSRQTPPESHIWCSLRQNKNICCTAGCGSRRGKRSVLLYFCK